MSSSKEVNQLIEKESSKMLPNFIQVWNSTENENCFVEKEYANIFIEDSVHERSKSNEKEITEHVSRTRNVSNENTKLDKMKLNPIKVSEEKSVSKNVQSVHADESKIEGIHVLEEEPLVPTHLDNHDKEQPQRELDNLNGKEHQVQKDLDEEEAFDKRDLDNLDETDYYDSEDEYREKEQTSTLMGKAFISLSKEFHHFEHVEDNNSRKVNENPHIQALRNSIKRFAEDNGFEIHDGPLDGACMFRSIADQLMINGRFGHTADDLREEALEYLRKNPLLADGTHTQYFLSKETWEQYLQRMQQTTEWGDHIVLKALVNKLNVNVVVLNVKEESVQRIELSPDNKSVDSWTITLTLGHLGEFHYLSLRPKLWRKYWPYKAILFKLQLSSHGTSSTIRDKILSTKLAKMGIKTLIEEAGFFDLRASAHDPPENFPKGHYSTNSDNTDNIASIIDQSVFSEENLNYLMEYLHDDTLSGVNLFKLSYFIKHLMPFEMIRIYTPELCHRMKHLELPILYEVMGSCADQTDVTLRDISAANTMLMHHDQKKVKQPVLIAMDLDVDVQHFNHICDRFKRKTVYYADINETHPGYCRLRKNLTDNSSYFEVEVREFTSNNFPYYCYKGFLCHTLPPNFRDWTYASWPPKAVKMCVSLMKCALLPKCHPTSGESQFEWKYNFSMAESCLIKQGLTPFQSHALYVLWIILENMTMHLQKPIKRKHLKAVFFNACEKLPQHAWETNIGGCFLFVISLLLACLKKRFLPHYFIPSNNIIDCYSSEEIDTLCVYVEAIRLFPIFTIQSVTELHGYLFGGRLSNHLFGNVPVKGVKSQIILRNKMVRSTIDAVKFYTRQGYYGVACNLLRDAHECLLLGPESDADQPSFQEFISAAIDELSQRSSRIILAKRFEKEHHLDFSDKYEAKNKILVRHILPWEVDYRLASLEIPVTEDIDFQFLADFFHSNYQENIAKKRNACLASLAIQTAVKCIDEAISSHIDVSKSSQDSKPYTRGKKGLSELKERKIHYLEDVYSVSVFLESVYPILDYVHDVEELCKDLPEHNDVLRKILRYTGGQRMCKNSPGHSHTWMDGNSLMEGFPHFHYTPFSVFKS
ncbi:uncharacterized protein LOC134281845 [Saccostrea cucullata]|uniref:uncharacterized protein LOC134281845 n=1 Tax=Saccostrea cuccullata TaxID=36930 RepID=UPI002ED47915